ncbi:hypothetical protein ACRAWB_16080 [Leifsonia poae]|uniref:hypothetical protein n=1 Tax=Leifsonia poae TaxID=110933 RepID=UPI003D699DEE
MFAVCFFLGAAMVLISWIPHAALIQDGYLPKFEHERYGAGLRWYLVVTTTVAGSLFGVAPYLPLAAGYDFSVSVLWGRHHSEYPLWLCALLAWTACAILFYRTGAGVWRRMRGMRGESPTAGGAKSLGIDVQEDDGSDSDASEAGDAAGTAPGGVYRRRRVRDQAHGEPPLPTRRFLGALEGPALMISHVGSFLLGLVVCLALFQPLPPSVGPYLAVATATGILLIWAVVGDRLGRPRAWLTNAALGSLLALAGLVLAIIKQSSLAEPANSSAPSSILRGALTIAWLAVVVGVIHVVVALIAYRRATRTSG